MSERRRQSETRAGVADAGKMTAIFVGASLILYELFVHTDGCAGMRNPCPPPIEELMGRLLLPTAH